MAKENFEKFRFSKAQRLQTPADFQAVFSLTQPIRSRSSYFTILARPNQGEYARLGVVVAKRFIKRAVRRNAIRRLIRESFRLHQQGLAGLDIVVVLRGVLPKAQNKFFYQCLEKQWQEVVAQWKNA